MQVYVVSTRLWLRYHSPIEFHPLFFVGLSRCILFRKRVSSRRDKQKKRKESQPNSTPKSFYLNLLQVCLFVFCFFPLPKTQIGHTDTSLACAEQHDDLGITLAMNAAADIA